MNLDEKMEELKRKLDDKMNKVQQKNDELMNRYGIKDNAQSPNTGFNTNFNSNFNTDFSTGFNMNLGGGSNTNFNTDFNTNFNTDFNTNFNTDFNTNFNTNSGGGFNNGINSNANIAASQPAGNVKYCPECGTMVTDDARFCGQCGNRLDGNATQQANNPMDDIKEIADSIKEDIENLGVDEFVLYTSDYCGDLDWEDVEKAVGDSTVSLELYFSMSETYAGETRNFVAPRKIHVDDDELLFDIEEVQETMDGDMNTIGEYEQQAIDDLVERYGTEAVKKCLESIYSYAFGSNCYDVAALNGSEDTYYCDEDDEEYCPDNGENSVTVSFGSGRGARICRLFNCTGNNEAINLRGEVMAGEMDSYELSGYIEAEFDDCCDLQYFMHSVENCQVMVYDENGKEILSTEEGEFDNSCLYGDPREWELDESVVSDSIKRGIEKMKQVYAECEEACLEETGQSYDEEFFENYLEDEEYYYIIGNEYLSSLIAQLAEDGTGPILAHTGELYGNDDTDYSYNIKLAAGEKFDINELQCPVHDYDGYFPYFMDSFLPIIKYKNRIYQTEAEGYDIHYDSYTFADIKDNYLEFDEE